MLTNRRTYQVEMGRFAEARSLAEELKEVLRDRLGIELRALQPIYGPAGVIVLEFDYADEVEMAELSRRWQAVLQERGLIRRWFAVAEFVSNELWDSIPSEELAAGEAPTPRD